MDDSAGKEFTGTMNATLAMAARFNTVRQPIGMLTGSLPQTVAAEPLIDVLPTGPVPKSLAAPPQTSSFDATVTREIEVYRDRQPHAYYDQSRSHFAGQARPQWDNRPPKRRPAPLALRIGVGAIASVFVLSVIGFGALSAKPSIFSSLRAQPPTAAVTPTTTATVVSHISLVTASTGSKGPVYRVPTNVYTVQVNVPDRAWLEIRSPATAVRPTTALMMTKANSPQRFDISGSAAITIAAQATSITLFNGAKNLGTIPAPRVGMTYTFEPPTE